MFASKAAFYFFLVQVIALQLIVANEMKSQELAEVKLFIEIKDAQPEQVFKKLESLTSFRFGYSRNALPRQIKLSYHGQETNLRDILLDVAEKAELKFKRIGHQILVLKDQRREKEPAIETLPDKTISGRVTDSATGEALSGASVAIKEYPNLGVIVDANGSYRLTMPDDAKTLVFSFVGYTTQEIAINDRSVINLQLTAALTDLDGVVVTGFKLQNQQQINLKKLAPVMAEFLVQDDIGRLPDFAAADAARRISGVHTVFQEDEATQVSVRGLPPIYTFSTIDGVFIPSGSRGSRVANFETIPSTAISKIEVYKSRTADQDANAIGGIFNLKTRSAFDVEDMFINGRATLGKYTFDEIPRSEQFRNNAGRNGLSNRSDLTITKRFGSNKQFGIVLSGSYNRKDRDELKVPKRNYNFLNDDPNLPVPNRFYATTYDNVIERFGGFGKLEFKPVDNLYMSVSTNYYKKTDDEVRMENRFRDFDFDEATVSNRGGSFNGSRVQLAYDLFIIEHRVQNTFFDTHYTVGKSTFKGKIGVTKGYLGQDGPWGGFNFNFDDRLSGTYTIGKDLEDFTLNFDTPSIYTDPGNWDSFYVGGRLFRDNEEATIGQLDYSFDNDEGPFSFKAGFNYRQIDHQFDRINQSSNYDSSLPLTFADFPLQDYFHPFFNNGQVGLIHFDNEGFEQWVANNADVNGLNNDFGTLYNRASAISLADRFIVDETVSALYFSGTLQLDRLTLIGGLRYESTRTDLIRVPAINGDRNENVLLTVENNYENLLPSLNAQLAISENLKLKAGYNKAIGRPDYQQLAPVTVVDDVLETRTIGNPDLKPRRSDNFDAQFEYYFDKGNSIFALGLFHKNITDDIQADQFVDPDDGYLVTTNFNSLGFDVTGFEVNFIKSDFKGVLPGFLGNLGLNTNLSFISGRREINPDQYVSSIANMPRILANVQLFYQTQKFDARLALNHTPAHVRHARDDNPSDPINFDTYWKAFSQYDFTTNYYLNDSMTAFFEARNFTNADRGYTMGTDLLIEDVVFGRSFWLGVTFRLNK